VLLLLRLGAVLAEVCFVQRAITSGVVRALPLVFVGCFLWIIARVCSR
jgi:hypothetical protein